MEKNKFINVPYDEFSVPTSTKIVTEISYLAYEKGLTGLYHLVNDNYCSKLELARSFFYFLHVYDVKLSPAPSSYFNFPAKRPFFSVLENSKIKKELNIESPHWKDSLYEFVRENYL